MNTSVETSGDNKSVFFPCSLAEVHLAFLFILLVTGIACNVPLVIFVLQKRAPHLSPDMLLILNLAGCNLLGLLVSLPLHTAQIVQQDYNGEIPSGRICVIRLFTLFVLYNESLFTLQAIAFDRADVLKHFQHQRKLNSMKTKFLILGILLASVVTTSVALLGEILKAVNPSQQNVVCPAFRPFHEMSYQTWEARITSITSSVTITFCTLTSCLYIFISFLKVTISIRKHRDQIEAQFGIRRATAEIKFTKKAFALTISYISTWAPFGVFNILRRRILTKRILCAFMWTMSTSYLSFIVVPVVYMIMDRRIWIKIKTFFGSNWSRVMCQYSAKNSRAVHPTVLANNGVEMVEKRTAVDWAR